MSRDWILHALEVMPNHIDIFVQADHFTLSLLHSPHPISALAPSAARFCPPENQITIGKMTESLPDNYLTFGETIDGH